MFSDMLHQYSNMALNQKRLLWNNNNNIETDQFQAFVACLEHNLVNW